MTLSKKERTQNDILKAAKIIVHTKGHDALTVRRLAEVTGFSYTNVYYYFKDLNTLFWALRLDLIEDMMIVLSSFSSKQKDPIDELVEKLCHYVNYYFENPNVFRFFYFNSFRQPEHLVTDRSLEDKFSVIWQTSFSRLIKEKVIRPNDVGLVAKAIVYAMHGMVMLHFSSNGQTSFEQVEKELAQTVKLLLRRI